MEENRKHLPVIVAAVVPPMVVLWAQPYISTFKTESEGAVSASMRIRKYWVSKAASLMTTEVLSSAFATVYNNVKFTFIINGIIYVLCGKAKVLRCSSECVPSECGSNLESIP